MIGHAGAVKGVSWFSDNMGSVRMSDIASLPFSALEELSQAQKSQGQ